MVGSTYHTDACFEDSRRQAEKAFFFGQVEWAEEFIRQVRPFVRPESDGIKDLVEAFVAGLRRQKVKEPEKPPCDALLFALQRLCRDYAQSELAAYAALLILSISEIPRSRAAVEMEQRTEAVLDEVYRRKWLPNVERLTKGYFDYVPGIQDWHSIEKEVREFVLSELQNWISFHDDGWPAPPEAGMNNGGNPAVTHVNPMVRVDNSGGSTGAPEQLINARKQTRRFIDERHRTYVDLVEEIRANPNYKDQIFLDFHPEVKRTQFYDYLSGKHGKNISPVKRIVIEKAIMAEAIRLGLRTRTNSD
jgi:hypothetical protein